MATVLGNQVQEHEYDVNFSDTREFALKRWNDAVVSVQAVLSFADCEEILQPRDSRTVYNDLRTQNADPQTAPNTRRLLNHVLHLPRTIETLIIFFTEAINPLEAGFNTLWGLLHLNILLSCVSTDKLKGTVGWSKKLRDVIELFNRCLKVCDDVNEARMAMVDVLENLLQIFLDSVNYLRQTDVTGSEEWRALDARITESLADIERLVRHLNNITSYSMVNIKNQAKNLEHQHGTGVPEKFSKFPILMVSKSQNKDFYCRDDELKRVDEHLNQKGANLLRTYTIYGRRGVGKTDIALQYAYTNPAGFEAIFWIQCETSITLRQSFTDMAIALDLPGADQHGHQEENQLSVQKWLKSTSCAPELKILESALIYCIGRRWLLVFDNAATASDGRGYWPVGSSGAILITSRKYYNFMFDSQRKGETIKPFTESQSWELLIRLLGPEWQDLQRRCLLEPCEVEAAKELLRNLSGLPLAIKLAAQLIKNPNIGGSTITSTYDAYKMHKSRLILREKVSDIVHSMDSLWNMSFSYLSKNAHDLLSVLSLLSPDGILIDLLLPRNQNALDGMLAFCKQDLANADTVLQGILSNRQNQPPPQLQEAITNLLNAALIKQEDRVIWVHRIVQEAMNYHSMKDLQGYFDSASALVFEAFPEQSDGEYSTKEERVACLSYIPHGAHLSMKFAEHCNAGTRLRGSPEFLKMLYNCAWYLYVISDYESCLRILDSAWLACEDTESLQYASLCNVAGCAYYGLNRLNDCRDKWSSFCKIQEKLLPPLDIRRSYSYHNIGNLESAYGNLDQALTCYEKALAIRLEGGEGVASLLANSYLGIARLCYLREEYDNAFHLLAKSEALFLQKLGANSYFMANVHYTYGNIHFAQNNWTAARTCYEASLRIGLATNAIHPLTAAAYYSLGCVEFEEKHHNKARGFLNKALTIARLRSPSRDDGTVARILWKTSVVLEDNRDGSCQKEATEMRLRADIALRKLTESGEGGWAATFDEEENADAVEIENAYDALVPGFFR